MLFSVLQGHIVIPAYVIFDVGTFPNVKDDVTN